MRNLFTLMALTLMVTGCIDANPYYEGQNVVLGDAAVPSETDGGTLGDDAEAPQPETDAEAPQPETDAEAPQGDAAVPDAAPETDGEVALNDAAPSEDGVYKTSGMLSRGCYMEEGSDTLSVGLGWSYANDLDNCVTIDLNREVTFTQVEIVAVRASANKVGKCLIPCSDASPLERGCHEGNDGRMSIAMSADKVVWTDPALTTVDALWADAEGNLNDISTHAVNVGSVQAQYIRVCRISDAAADSDFPGLIIDAVEVVEAE